MLSMNAISEIVAEPQQDETTSSGLPFVGELHWGDHFCQFYETAADLRDCLVPYFKAGVQNNEKCIWVTSPPLDSDEATAALRMAVPGLDAALARGQIEIMDHADWYLRQGSVSPEELPRLWLSRVESALAEGYAGLRITGNVAFLEPADWDNFMHYEETVHRCFHGQRIVALCSYPLRHARAEAVLDIIRRHGFAIARRDGRWDTIESASLAAAKEELARANRELEQRVEERTAVLQEALTERKRVEAALRERERWYRELLEALPAAVYTTDAAGRITYYNQAAVDLSGIRPKLGSDYWCVNWRLYWPDGTPMPRDQCPMAVALKENRPVRGGEVIAERPDGTRVPFIPYPTPVHDESGALVGAVNMLVDITERKQAEERTRLLAREVDHRAKNMLAIVQAILRMTRAETVPAFVETLTGRLNALSRAHALLVEGRWVGADLKRLVEDELAAYRTGDSRVTISGPGLLLSAEAAQVLAMTLHELATNAAKYGALSVPSGHMAVEWSWDSDEQLVLLWTETGGPPIHKPSRLGFGSSMIEGAVKGQLDGAVELHWLPEGLICRMIIPRKRLLDDIGRVDS